MNEQFSPLYMGFINASNSNNHLYKIYIFNKIYTKQIHNFDTNKIINLELQLVLDDPFWITTLGRALHQCQ